MARTAKKKTTKPQAKPKPKRSPVTKATGSSVLAREAAFVDEFCESLSKTQAYRAAFPAAARWKPATVNRKAQEFYQRPRVKEAIEAREREKRSTSLVTQARVLEELAAIAFSDSLSVIEEVMRRVSAGEPLCDMPDAQRRVVRSLSITKSGIKIECESKSTALDMLMRHLGCYKLPETAGVPVSPVVWGIMPPGHREPE